MDALIAELRELYGRTGYGHKTHERQAEMISKASYSLKILELVLVAATTGGLLTLMVSNEALTRVVSTVASIGALLLTMYFYRFDPDTRIRSHKATAQRLWRVRETIQALLTDITDAAVTSENARKERDNILRELNEIYANAPETNRAAYNSARDALKIHEELTFSNEELDKLLPGPLKVEDAGLAKPAEATPARRVAAQPATPDEEQLPPAQA